MASYWTEFAEVAGAHLLAVAAPGPDIAIVLKQSLAHGRRTGIWTGIGVGTALMIHVSYSLLGIGVLLKSSPLLFNGVKYAGAAYLAWIGIQALRAKPQQGDLGAPPDPSKIPTTKASFLTGFLTNVLNPKVGLFFLALFITVISPTTPKWIQACYGLWMVLATMGWFALVSVIFTRPAVRRTFLKMGHWIDRVLGVAFLAFALSLALASAHGPAGPAR